MRSHRFGLLLAFLLHAAPAAAEETVTPASVPEQDLAPSPASRSTSSPTAESRAPEPATEANSPGLLVAGIVVGGVGFTAAAVALIAVDGGACQCFLGDRCDQTGCTVSQVSLLAGPILVVASVPMIIAGAWQVPSDERGIPPTTAELRVGPGSTSLAVTF